MKNLLVGISGLALIGLVACANLGSANEIRGYPVYKFLNFWTINEKAFKANQAANRELLGKGFDDLVKIHELFVSRGFDLHTPLIVQTASGEELEVYIRNEDYDLLWRTNPHELTKQNRSHLVTIKYVQVTVGKETVKRAVSLQAQLLDREPVIRK